MGFTILSGIYLSLGANYLTSDESGPLIVMQGVFWLLAGSGLVFVSEVIRDSVETNLRQQRADLIMKTAESADMRRILISQLEVIQPQLQNMELRLQSLFREKPKKKFVAFCSVLFGVILPPFVGLLLLVGKITPSSKTAEKARNSAAQVEAMKQPLSLPGGDEGQRASK